MHGNPGSSEDWADLMPYVGEFARVIAPDMPGYGKADRPRDFEYTVFGYAKYLGALVDSFQIKRVHLVLHDFGGPWSLAWAAQNQSKIASITLINTGFLPGYHWHKFAKIWRTPVIGELFQLLSSRFGFKAVLNGENPKPFPEAFLNRMYDDMDWGMKRGVLKLYRATSDFDGMAREIGGALKPLALPALVIWGEKDKYLPGFYAEKQKDFFNADVHLISGCGHWPFVDEFEKTKNLLIPFLADRVSVFFHG